MLQLLNPWMLLGLIAVAAPVLIHLLHRYRVHNTPFSGMRYLDQVMIRLQRTLRWQSINLLLLRCAAIALLVCSLCQPLWRSAIDHSQALQRQGATAAVIIFDNSASSQKQLTYLKELAHQYIDTLRSGDAVSIISVDSTRPQTLYDFKAAHLIIDRIQANDSASDYSRLLHNAQRAMRKHVNPHIELIIVSDGQQSSWDETSLQQLQTLHESHNSNKDQSLRCVALHPEHDGSRNNSAIRLLKSNQQVLAVGQRFIISIAIQHNGDVPQHQCIVRIRGDGHIIDERIVNREAGVEEIIHCEYQFNEAGSHYISAELVGLRDAIPSDNIRYTSIAVTDRIPVLLIDNHQGKQLRFIQHALNASNNNESTFAVSNAHISELTPEFVSQYPIIILADTAALDNQAITCIERYIVGGGNMIALLGEQSEAAIINSLWSRNGDGFLPCNVLEKTNSNNTSTLYPQIEDLRHPAFATLPEEAQQLFSGCTVYRHMPLDISTVINDDKFNILMSFNNGDAFLAERQRGQGRVLLCSSNFSIDWSDIASHGIFVPWMRSLCSYLSSFLLPPRNILCGEQIVHLHPQKESCTFNASDGSTIGQERSTWQGQQVSRSDTIWSSGLYSARQRSAQTWYAVNVPSVEHTVEYTDQEWFDEQAAPILTLHSKQDIEHSWGDSSDNTTPLWHIGILAALLLMAAELVYCRNLSQASFKHE